MPHIFGLLPGRHVLAAQPKIDSEPEGPHMTKPASTADLILHHGLFTTLDRANPTATAVAIRDGRFLAVGATTR